MLPNDQERDKVAKKLLLGGVIVDQLKLNYASPKSTKEKQILKMLRVKIGEKVKAFYSICEKFEE